MFILHMTNNRRTVGRGVFHALQMELFPNNRNRDDYFISSYERKATKLFRKTALDFAFFWS
jgi:hypothetical protein